MSTTPKSTHHKDKEEIRRDRIHAIVTVVVLILLFGLFAALAGFVSPSSGELDYQRWLLP